jgi:arabinogalactan oligomer/maltooligosaccharide transport system substrate-binding protein
LWVIVGGIAIVVVVVLGLVFAADNFGWFTPEEAVEYSEEGEGEIPMEAAYDSDLSGDLTLWHDYGEDDPRSDALDMLIERAMELAPELNIHALRTDSTAQLYSAEGANGEGPDLLIANSGNLRSWVDEDLVLPLWEVVDFDTDAYQGSAVDSMIVYDELYGLPLSPFVVGTYYNRSLVAHPPENVEQMMEVIMDESHLASPLNSYFLYGFFGAFGAHVLDEEGRCVAVETGGEDALWYLLDLQEAGAHYTEYAEAERLFLDWEKGLLINGPWVLGQYREIFGEDLGFVPLPAGPGGPARPLLSYEGVYVNPRSENIDAALRLVEFLGSQEAGQVFSDVALVVPARGDVEMHDPIQRTFFEAVDQGDMIVKRWEFENYWEPFRAMFFDVLEGGAPPEGALIEACAVMNELNEK